MSGNQWRAKYDEADRERNQLRIALRELEQFKARYSEAEISGNQWRAKYEEVERERTRSSMEIETLRRQISQY